MCQVMQSLLQKDSQAKLMGLCANRCDTGAVLAQPSCSALYSQHKADSIVKTAESGAVKREAWRKTAGGVEVRIGRR